MQAVAPPYPNFERVVVGLDAVHDLRDRQRVGFGTVFPCTKVLPTKSSRLRTIQPIRDAPSWTNPTA